MAERFVGLVRRRYEVPFSDSAALRVLPDRGRWCLGGGS
jgi:hypothetical protein